MIYELVFSATGRTEKVLDIISRCFEGEKTKIDLSAADFKSEQFIATQNDFCMLAVPVYGGRMPAPAVNNLKKLQGNGAKVLLVAVFGNRAVDDCLLEMKDVMEERGFVPIAAIEASVQHSIITQVAKNRPDVHDTAQLEEFAHKVKNLLSENTVFSRLQVPGNRPYMKMSAMPLSPKADKRCTDCGLCAAKCPAKAIPENNFRITDKSKCILCMRCVENCTAHARDFSPVLMNIVNFVAKPVFRGRKPNVLYMP